MPSDTDVRAALEQPPINMLLFCPLCGIQHIDEPDERTDGWNNPPHRSHLCHACGCIWRPADVPTNGVVRIATVGKADTWGESNSAAIPGLQPSTSISEDRAREEVVSAVYVAMYGEGMDPHQHPEGWDYAEEITGAALKAAFARETTPPVEGVRERAKVERVETVPFDHPFSDERTPPIWRVLVGGYCADFEFEQVARNFAGAINASSAPVDDISYAGAEMEDGPATPPVDAGVKPDREAIARICAKAMGDDLEAFGQYWVETPFAEAADAILAILPKDMAAQEWRERADKYALRLQTEFEEMEDDAAELIDEVSHFLSFSTPTASEETVRLLQDEYNQLEAAHRGLLTSILGAIDTGRSEPLFIARDQIRNYLDSQALTMEGEGAQSGA